MSEAEARLRRSLADLRQEVAGVLSAKPAEERKDAFEGTLRTAFDTFIRFFGLGGKPEKRG